MISNKHINKIIIALTSIAVVVTFLFYLLPIKQIKNKNSNLLYETTVFDKDSVMEINIDISDENWTYLTENATDEEYVPANITINGKTYNNVGIRAKGNSTLTMMASSDSDRYSFKVKFDEYVDGQTLDGLSKLVLNNVMSDATYMKEYLSYDLLNKIGVNTPLFSYSNISINNDNFGLYFALETIEEEFISRNYGSLEGNLYKPESMDMNGIGGMGGNKGDFDPSEIMNGNFPEGFDPSTIMNGNSPEDFDPSTMMNGNSPEGFDPSTMSNGDAPNGFDPSTMSNGAIPNMGGGFGGSSSGGGNLVYIDDELDSYSTIFESAKLDTTSQEDQELVIEMLKNLSQGTNLEEYLNVEEILRYFAVNTFIVNLDSYVSNMNHNYYLYERDGIFEILPWDYNLAFGGYGINDASSAINFPIDSPVTDSEGNSPLIEKLLEVDEYKDLYHNYLQEIVNYVNSGKYESIIENNNNLISSYVKEDSTAFYSYEEYEVALDNLINFGIDRAKSIEEQLNGNQPSTSYGNIETNVNLSAMGTNSVGGSSPDRGRDMNIPKSNQSINNENGNNQPDLPSDTENQNGVMPNPNINGENGEMVSPPTMDEQNGMAVPPNNGSPNGEMTSPSGSQNGMPNTPNSENQNGAMTFPPDMQGQNPMSPPTNNGNTNGEMSLPNDTQGQNQMPMQPNNPNSESINNDSNQGDNLVSPNTSNNEIASSSGEPNFPTENNKGKMEFPNNMNKTDVATSYLSLDNSNFILTLVSSCAILIALIFITLFKRKKYIR